MAFLLSDDYSWSVAIVVLLSIAVQVAGILQISKDLFNIPIVVALYLFHAFNP
jgi:H+/gluconate symporter-like permease